MTHQRRLAGAVLAHEGDELAAAQLQADALQHGLAGRRSRRPAGDLQHRVRRWAGAGGDRQSPARRRPVSSSRRRASLTVIGKPSLGWSAAWPLRRRANRRVTGGSSSRWRPPPSERSFAARRRTITAPSSMYITRVARCRQRSTRCSASMIVAPVSSVRRRTAASSSSELTGSSCEVGSSSRRSCGCMAMTAARATFCSSPPESVASSARRRRERPSEMSDSSTRRVMRRSRRPGSRGRRRSRVRRWSSRPGSRGPGTPGRRCRQILGAALRVSLPATSTRPAKVPPWK